MEKLAGPAAITLTESVLGAAVVLLIVLIFVIMRLVFKHMRESDERWTKAVDKNTDALKGIGDAQTASGDKIAISIERALLYKSVSDHGNDNPK